SVLDPAIGTGGMFLGMARAMRNAGRRPHLCSWTGVDVDPVAVACAAVNGFVWMLGPFVRLVVANALTFDVATLPGCGDPAFQPIVEAWNLRALATWHRCHQSCPTTVRDGELHAGPGVRGGDGAVTAPASAEAR
ncbi:MAG TPA: hypothetical protein VNW94_18540, partial [Streptosporangiaceae bacterium]|nr:hypothetical protein [Streptosporangiaceae bacterium]